MRGRFTPGTNAEEWCERRLLARIHHYTVKRLRAEIEPVAARDFLRFLLAWQRVAPDARMQGPKAVDTVVAQLEGFEAPAGAWETEILPARLAGYEPHWLDASMPGGTCRVDAAAAAQRDAQTAARAAQRRCARRRSRCWRAATPRSGRRSPRTADGAHVSPRAQAVADHLRQHGASFFDELVDGTGLLRSQLEEALAELVAVGLVSSDSFGGLRALLVPSGERRPIASGRRRRRTVKFGMEAAGRWALARRPRKPETPAQAKAFEQEAIEHVARALLRRYGVVFWRLLEREAAWLPPWRDLLRVYRRLESRGEIRGGRFVAGFTGEQFALPDAIGMLREVRRQPAAGALGLAVRRRPAQSRGHPDAGAEARRAERQSPALPRRPADRRARRRRRAVSRRAGCRERMAGPQGLAARRARAVDRSRQRCSARTAPALSTATEDSNSRRSKLSPTLVSQFRSSHHCAAPSFANFGIDRH